MNMVQTNITRPKGILQDFIQSFELREFDTFNEFIKKPCYASHEIHISLLIDSNNPSFEPISNNISGFDCDGVKPPYSGVMGLQSNMKGFLIFHGRFKIFTIQFKPIGFSGIFQIPASLLNDNFFDAQVLFNQDLNELHEKLHEKITFIEMVLLVQKFLEQKLAENRKIEKFNCIRNASNSLINEPNLFSIKQLAYHSNMTLKTFERNFTVMVGLPPKMYSRIRRFNKAIELKQYHDELSWLEVCDHTGYFDLMHLNKDFKAFAGNTPANFFKKTPPVSEEYSTMSY